jgi:hypothetical protein
MPGISNSGWPLLPVVGSGQFGTPWERMHRAKFSMPVKICRAWC